MNHTKPYKFTGEILDVTYETIEIPDNKKTRKKVVLDVKSKKGHRYRISEAFIKVDEQELCRGIWFNLDNEGKPTLKSTLQSVMDFFEIRVLEELKGKFVTLRHNPKGYIVIECLK